MAGGVCSCCQQPRATYKAQFQAPKDTKMCQTWILPSRTFHLRGIIRCDATSSPMGPGGRTDKEQRELEFLLFGGDALFPSGREVLTQEPDRFLLRSALVLWVKMVQSVSSLPLHYGPEKQAGLGHVPSFPKNLVQDPEKGSGWLPSLKINQELRCFKYRFSRKTKKSKEERYR